MQQPRIEEEAGPIRGEIVRARRGRPADPLDGGAAGAAGRGASGASHPEDEPEGPLRFRRPYLKIVAAAAVAVAIVGAGLLGPHAGPLGPTTGPVESALAVIASPAVSTPVASTPGVPTQGQPAAPRPAASRDVGRGSDGLTGMYGPTGPSGLDPNALQPLFLQRGDLKIVPLSDNITSDAIAALGTRLFYVRDGNRIVSTDLAGAGSSATRTVADATPCHSIGQVVAAGHFLAYVETAPAGNPLADHGCGTPGVVAWTIRLLDLNGGLSRTVASGRRDVPGMSQLPAGADPVLIEAFPVHIALSPTAYAFDRPPTVAGGTGETVEVHAIAGDALLWSARTTALVAGVMLGGSRLAVLTINGGMELRVADAIHPTLGIVARPATGASLSQNGEYLTWDLAAPANRRVVVVERLGPSGATRISTSGEPGWFYGSQPIVSSAARGPTLAWYENIGVDSVYPAYSDTTGTLVAIPTLQEPIWLHLDGSLLIWVSADIEGGPSVAFATDLSQVRPISP